MIRPSLRVLLLMVCAVLLTAGRGLAPRNAQPVRVPRAQPPPAEQLQAATHPGTVVPEEDLQASTQARPAAPGYRNAHRRQPQHRPNAPAQEPREKSVNKRIGFWAAALIFLTGFGGGVFIQSILFGFGPELFGWLTLTSAIVTGIAGFFTLITFVGVLMAMASLENQKRGKGVFYLLLFYLLSIAGLGLLQEYMLYWFAAVSVPTLTSMLGVAILLALTLIAVLVIISLARPAPPEAPPSDKKEDRDLHNI